MVTYHESLASIEGVDEFSKPSVISEGDVSEVVDVVVDSDARVPFINNGIVHSINGIKGSDGSSVFGLEFEDVVVEEVGVRYEPLFMDCHSDLLLGLSLMTPQPP